MELTLDQALQKGVEAHKAGKAEEADRYYTAILKANPKHPDANHNMGVLAVGVSKVQEALPFFKTALEANPNVAQYWLSYVEALIKLNQIDEAKIALDEAKGTGVKNDRLDQIEKQLNNNPSHSPNAQGRSSQPLNNLFNKAIELRENGKYDEAIDLLLHQIKQSPTDPNIPAVLSHCYILNDNLEQAKIYLDAAKDINPNDEIIEDKGVKVFIDSAAVMYLLGTEMDYKKEEFSSSFVFNNPNESERCGCGESFKV